MLPLATVVAAVVLLAPPSVRSVPTTVTASAPVAAPAPSSGPAIAPEFSLEDTTGKTVRLSDLRGKVVVIEFWATWCAPCASALPVIADAVKAAGSDVVFLALNTDDNESKEKIRSFLAGRKLSIQALIKGRAVSKQFGVGPIPHTVVIDRNGRIAAKYVGFRGEAACKADLARDLRAALDRK